MTASQLQNIARQLSNSSWCRHWLNWSDTVMAIQCRDESGHPMKINRADANRFGFEEQNHYVYTIPRTNDDGTPYQSKLFAGEPEPQGAQLSIAQPAPGDLSKCRICYHDIVAVWQPETGAIEWRHLTWEKSDHLGVPQ